MLLLKKGEFTKILKKIKIFLKFLQAGRFRFKSQPKNGPPSMAVIIPTGISVGARRVLAKVSQITKKLAPNKVEAGIRTLRSGPTYNRTI